MHDFVLSNKFDYGYNPIGGRALSSVVQNQEKKVEANEIKKIVHQAPLNDVQCAANKANDVK